MKFIASSFVLILAIVLLSSCGSESVAVTEPSSSGYSGSSSGSGGSEEYWCMGKNDTCPNKTSSAYDFYCSSCDKDGNNIEDSRE